MEGSTPWWREELEAWLKPFIVALGDRRRGRMCPLYVAGLIGPGDRKSIQPMAAREAGAGYDQLHHFIGAGTWDQAPLERALLQEADRLVGGEDAFLIIDDTALPKKGAHSVGVAQQYAGALGKNANCQALVSTTLSKDEVPVMVGLRLFLPQSWTSDPVRMTRARVPPERQAAKTKPQIALEEIDRVRAAGVHFGCVLADAGYGVSAGFRQGLSERGLSWAVGIAGRQKVYPADVALIFPVSGHGRPRQRHVPDVKSAPAEKMLETIAWRTISWRRGTKGMLKARFAAMRIRVADGERQRIGDMGQQALPGEEAWLIGERRSTGERKYYLSNLPADCTLKALAAAVKARWACEQAHQQLKEELGLDHFEGRSWTGLHRHVLMTMIAYAFLQSRRLAQAGGGKKNPRPAATAKPAGGPTGNPGSALPVRPSAMSALQGPAHA
jgi:SRSO17 transposase